MTDPILAPMLALVGWTFVMSAWMYATRIPAIRAAGIDPAVVKEKSALDVLPLRVRQVADNYNHLHEQPVLFYALCAVSALAGASDGLSVGLAWGYVAVRVVHSLVQATINFIPLRFSVFMVGTIVLFVLFLRTVLALQGG